MIPNLKSKSYMNGRRLPNICDSMFVKGMPPKCCPFKLINRGGFHIYSVGNAFFIVKLLQGINIDSLAILNIIYLYVRGENRVKISDSQSIFIVVFIK